MLVPLVSMYSLSQSDNALWFYSALSDLVCLSLHVATSCYNTWHILCVCTIYWGNMRTLCESLPTKYHLYILKHFVVIKDTNSILHINCLNPLSSDGIMWRQTPWSALVQVIACPLLGIKPYLNPSWYVSSIGLHPRNSIEISINTRTCFVFKMHLKMSSAKRWPFCLGLSVLADHISWCSWWPSSAQFITTYMYYPREDN